LLIPPLRTEAADALPIAMKYKGNSFDAGLMLGMSDSGEARSRFGLFLFLISRGS
jgi:hypothetical protein